MIDDKWSKNYCNLNTAGEHRDDIDGVIAQERRQMAVRTNALQAHLSVTCSPTTTDKQHRVDGIASAQMGVVMGHRQQTGRGVAIPNTGGAGLELSWGVSPARSRCALLTLQQQALWNKQSLRRRPSRPLWPADANTNSSGKPISTSKTLVTGKQQRQRKLLQRAELSGNCRVAYLPYLFLVISNNYYSFKTVIMTLIQYTSIILVAYLIIHQMLQNFHDPL